MSRERQLTRSGWLKRWVQKTTSMWLCQVCSIWKGPVERTSSSGLSHRLESYEVRLKFLAPEKIFLAAGKVVEAPATRPTTAKPLLETGTSVRVTTGNSEAPNHLFEYKDLLVILAFKMVIQQDTWISPRIDLPLIHSHPVFALPVYGLTSLCIPFNR